MRALAPAVETDGKDETGIEFSEIISYMQYNAASIPLRIHMCMRVA